jgi:aconitate hydratase A / 2-methylisocitrate dehydratase
VSAFANSFKTLSRLKTATNSIHYFSLPKLATQTKYDLNQLPFSIKVLLEAVLRAENNREILAKDVLALAAYNPKHPQDIEVPYKPARVLLQDFTGVPAVVDLAAMRSAVARLGGDPKKINPQIPVNLVIDHSVQVDDYGNANALENNVNLEFKRNGERYSFLRWGQSAFDNFHVVPPASGICHQVNLEYLGKVVQLRKAGELDIAFPDTLVGTDSHTPMVNALGVVGWGVGGIEAEAMLLGQPLYMLPPAVVGVKLEGTLPSGSTATDLVLLLTELLRNKGVVGKFVEFYGPGLSNLKVTDRATLANMAPEYGATIGFFPTDELTLGYLDSTGRPPELVDLVRNYCTAQDLFRTNDTPDPDFEDTVEIDLSTVRRCLAGPKRPQDRIEIPAMKGKFHECLKSPAGISGFGVPEKDQKKLYPVTLGGGTTELSHGTVGIASITSCTNTSNPSVMLAAGLLAKKAVEKGLTVKPWVKTSMAPGSRVVTEYLRETGLLPFLEELGFHVVGYGCTVCIGNSGPLSRPISDAVEQGLVLASVVSGNRNFEGRINPLVEASYLASPPLVVAYALTGTVVIDLDTESIGTDSSGNPVMLADLWPTDDEIAALLDIAFRPDVYKHEYDGIENSNDMWNSIPVVKSDIFNWQDDSTYIQEPPFFVDMKLEVKPIKSIQNARVLALLGNTITTDHISPAGSIPTQGPAGKYLVENNVDPIDFNSFGSRRGNDRVMTRGTFANIRLRNQLAPNTEGGWTTDLLTGEITSIFEASEHYKENEIPTIVIGGKDYGMGSSRDWAAKGTVLLGIKAVIAESFERIHRSNLVGMGVLPLTFVNGENAASLDLTGHEIFSIAVDDKVSPHQKIKVTAKNDDGKTVVFQTLCRLDTPIDVEYYRNGGILHTVLRALVK